MKNADRLQTALGAAEAGGIGIMDALVHLGPDGLDWHAKTFWLGLALAFLRAFKSYYAAGIQLEEKRDSRDAP